MASACVYVRLRAFLFVLLFIVSTSAAEIQGHLALLSSLTKALILQSILNKAMFLPIHFGLGVKKNDDEVKNFAQSNDSGRSP